MAGMYAVALGRRAGYISIAFASRYTGYENPGSVVHIRLVYFSFSIQATVSAVKSDPRLNSPRRYLNVLLVVAVVAGQLYLEGK